MLRRLSKRANERAHNEVAEFDRVSTESESANREVTNLMKLVKAGLESTSDLLFADTYRDAKTKAAIAAEALRRVEARMDTATEVTAVQINAFAELMKDRLHNGDKKMKRALLASVTDKVVVAPTTINVYGRKAKLHEAIANGGALLSNQTEPVPRRMQEWCTRKDSNL